MVIHRYHMTTCPCGICGGTHLAALEVILVFAQDTAMWEFHCTNCHQVEIVWTSIAEYFTIAKNTIGQQVEDVRGGYAQEE